MRTLKYIVALITVHPDAAILQAAELRVALKDQTVCPASCPANAICDVILRVSEGRSELAPLFLQLEVLLFFEEPLHLLKDEIVLLYSIDKGSPPPILDDFEALGQLSDWIFIGLYVINGSKPGVSADLFQVLLSGTMNKRVDCCLHLSDGSREIP